MTAETGRWVLDRPNSYIGRSVPRPNTRRLAQGRGPYVDDIVLPRMAHAAFVRCPHAHARITSIDAAKAKAAPGVIAVVTGAELAERLGGDEAGAIRILYGGSVKSENAAALLTLADVDGGLIGGASLDANGFWSIAESCV